LNGATRKPAHGELGCSFHEQNHGVAGDGFVNGIASAHKNFLSIG
jgi:hypothetical protein